MKNIQLDISTIILIILSCFSGNFKKVIIISIILFFHELGHLFYLTLFKVPIINIKVYPFGSLIKTEKLINYSPFKELLISSAGLINQVLLFFLFSFLYKYNFINTYSFSIFKTYNISIFLFNILPIYPLDGYIILSSIFNIFIPFIVTHNLSFRISIVFMIIFITYSFNMKINSIIVITFLIYKLFTFIKEKKYIDNKFLLERVLYSLPYRKIKYNKKYNKNYLMLDTYHYFNYINETSIISKLYLKK